jgi:hypothetical protein
MDRAGAVVALGALLGLAPSAAGHGVEYPKRDTLQVAPQSVTLRIEYVVASAEESALLARLFDRDRSGALEPGEQQALREHLCRQADAFVRLELDGRPLPLRRTQAELGRPGRGELLAISMTLTAAIPGTAPAHTLRLFDRHKDRALAVPVRVTAQGVQLTTRLPPLPLLTAEQPLQLAFVGAR